MVPKKQKEIMKALGANGAIPLYNRKLSGPIDWLGLAELLKKRFVSCGSCRKTIKKKG